MPQLVAILGELRERRVQHRRLPGDLDAQHERCDEREREDWGVRTVGQILPSFQLPPLLVILAGTLYAGALAQGAHWHNLPRPEEPLRGIAGCGPRVKWLRANTPAKRTSTGAR